MTGGVIVRGMGGLYTARDDAGDEYVLRAKKKFRRARQSPLVGDKILFTPGAALSDEHGWIEEILPRQSECLRPPVANVTRLCIVAAPQPAPDWLLVDKLLLFARQQYITPLLVINKCDMTPVMAEQAAKDYAGADLPVLGVSAGKGEGLEALRAALGGQLTCFAGQSGVGKSTLLNALFGLSLETGDISQRIMRGKNTTRHAELFTVGDISVLDTPGFSLLEMDQPQDPVLLQQAYPEFTPYDGKCRFAPCYHSTEPGCAVLAAAKAGEISAARLSRYHELLALSRQLWRERYD